MQVDLQGVLVYERSSPQQSFPRIRRFEKNWDAAERSVLESLTYTKKHKQPAADYIVLDTETGRMQYFTLEDLEACDD